MVCDQRILGQIRAAHHGCHGVVALEDIALRVEGFGPVDADIDAELAQVEQLGERCRRVEPEVVRRDDTAAAREVDQLLFDQSDGPWCHKGYGEQKRLAVPKFVSNSAQHRHTIGIEDDTWIEASRCLDCRV